MTSRGQIWHILNITLSFSATLFWPTELILLRSVPWYQHAFDVSHILWYFRIRGSVTHGHCPVLWRTQAKVNIRGAKTDGNIGRCFLCANRADWSTRLASRPIGAPRAGWRACDMSNTIGHIVRLMHLVARSLTYEINYPKKCLKYRPNFTDNDTEDSRQTCLEPHQRGCRLHSRLGSNPKCTRGLCYYHFLKSKLKSISNNCVPRTP
jgi:hypothetical protein